LIIEKCYPRYDLADSRVN